MFTIEKIIQKDSENFKIALIDITRNLEKSNQTSEERLMDIITASHKVSLKTMLLTFEELISDYNTWLMNNYKIEPLPDSAPSED